MKSMLEEKEVYCADDVEGLLISAKEVGLFAVKKSLSGISKYIVDMRHMSKVEKEIR